MAGGGERIERARARWARAAARLQPAAKLWRSHVAWLAMLVLFLSLTASTFALFQHVASDEGTQRLFEYPAERLEDMSEIRKEFRPRVAAIWMMSKLHSDQPAVMRKRIAGYCTAWFALACVAYVFADRRAAPFAMLGTFAALYYCSTPRGLEIWHPWDLPVLALSAIGLAAALRRSAPALFAVVVVGVLFKETLVLLWFLPLFFEGKSWRARLAWAGATLAVGYGIRLGLEIALDTGIGPNAMSYRLEDKSWRALRWMKNLAQLGRPTWNHVALANAGTIFLLFVLPARRRVLGGYKLVVALLLLGLFFAGNYTEMRTFLDALPAGLLLLFDAFYPPAAAPEPGRGDVSPPGRETGSGGEMR